MSNGSNYFSHDSNARNDAKLIRLRIKHKAAGYGVYFMILERLREETDYVSAKDYDMIAFDLRVDAALVKSVVEDFGLFAFTEDGKCFYSESFNRRMSMKDNVKAKRAEAGKKGVLMREQRKKELSETDANASENGSKESKGKKSKENKVVEDDETRAPAHEREPDEKDWRDELVCNTEFVETLAINNGTTCDTAVGLIREFHSECAAKGIRHTGYGDYRRHCYDWSRAHLSKLTGRAGQRQKAPPATHATAIPTEQEMQAEAKAKTEAERKRVAGIYEGAKNGNKRFIAIVTEWAKNGTLAQYGLAPLEQET